MTKFFWTALCFALIMACQPAAETEEKEITPAEGKWRAAISLNDSVDMPFTFSLQSGDDSNFTFTIFNGEERVEALANWQGDSLKVFMPVFANYLLLTAAKEEMKGYYINPDADNYRLPFVAHYGDSLRFESGEKNCCDINEKWRVRFSPNSADSSDGIAYFEQDGNKISGTIMTETGDYRYLEGVLSGNTLRLSTFDGAHLFYFESDIVDGQEMRGRFYSGRSFMEEWVAWRDSDFELADPDTLTYLNEGFETVDFRFPNLIGDTIALSDSRFEGKPVIIQVMGSWCPNCMDESRYLREIYSSYHHEGLEIVGLTFERARDKTTAKKRALKMVDDLKLPYPVLMAGYTRQDRAADKLPMLNHIMSYPTTIYLNKEHQVVKIHTGFSGPGTPVYEDYTASNKIFIEKLLASDRDQS